MEVGWEVYRVSLWARMTGQEVYLGHASAADYQFYIAYTLDLETECANDLFEIYHSEHIPYCVQFR